MEALHAIFSRVPYKDGKDGAPFHIRMKTHLLLHLALDQINRWGSPRNAWCYRDESFVGALKLVCARLKHPWTLEETVTLKTKIFDAVQTYEMT